jgi:threonine aldolase
MKIVDLRSDTVTQPTTEMRAAIASAEVDDDCYGTDPTANALEARIAELLGKEAAVFTITGTMANCIAIGAQSRLGDEIIFEAKAHPINYEAGAPAANFGVQTTGITTERGLLDPDVVRSYVRSKAMYHAETVLLSVENTHNAHGGTVYPIEQLHALADVAHEKGIRVHMDGARIWNACAAGGHTEAELVEPFDTVSVCFSKGLGAPMGSALAGDAQTMARARKLRRRLGGGWRQAGILAAGALHAVTHHRGRIVDDHRRAKHLSDKLRTMTGLTTIEPESNILMVDTTDSPLSAAEWSRQLADLGVRQNALGPERVRLVTHLDVDDAGVDYAIEMFRQIAENN